MAVLSQFNYIFVITTIFAFLDAWNIGESSGAIPLTVNLV